MPDYTLSAKITGDSKSYKKAVNEAERANDDLKESVSDTNDSMAESQTAAESTGSKFAGLAKKVGALAVSYGLLKGATEGIKYNAEMEQYQTSFEVMTGSADKAAETVDKLKKIAANTPFEMPQLAEVTQLLMNYGFTADEALNRMSMLGDIAQGDADKMQRIAAAYGQMSSAGKVSLEDIKQMIEAGFNPLTEISESTGESMESLYDRISKGTISVDEITASMQRSTSEGGKYFQSMEKQSDTLSGKFSTLKDTVSEKLGGAFKGLTDFLRDHAIPAAIELLNNFEKYKPILVILGIAIGTITALIIAYNIQQALATAELTLWQAISAGATVVTNALAGAFTFLTSPIGLVIIAIGAVIAIGYLLITHWEEVKQFAIDTWTKIKHAFMKFGHYLTAVFSTDWTQSFGVFGNILNGFFATAKGVGDSIKSVFSGIVDFVAGIFTGDWERAWQGVVDIFTGIWGLVTAPFRYTLNGIISLINMALDGINKISVDIPEWAPVGAGKHFGFNIPKIPYLLHGTMDWQGGFARMNEGGRGELTYLPNGSQVIPHDISVTYAKEVARLNARTEPVDIKELLEGIVVQVFNQVSVDGTPLKEKAAAYTIRKISGWQAAGLRAKGVT